MKKKFIKAACIFYTCVIPICMVGCGNSSVDTVDENLQQEHSVDNTDGENIGSDENNEIQYDENGNPIEQEERTDKNILAADAEEMVTGFIAILDNGEITKNGIWMSEEEVGMIAGMYNEFLYTYEKGSLSKSEAAYIACFYDINGDPLGSIYMDKNAGMYYNNKYKINDPQIRGIFVSAKDRIEEDSVLDFDNSSIDTSVDKNTTDGSGQTQEENTQQETSTNATVEISKETFLAVEGIDEDVALVLAQSAFNLGIPAVKRAAMEANTIVFTDINDIEYTMAIVDNRIVSVYNETNGIYLYQQGEAGHET